MMKLKGEVMSKKEEKSEEGTGSVRHYYLCVLDVYPNSTEGEDGGQEVKKSHSVKYSSKALKTITWLAVAQVIFGIAVIGMQCVATYYGDIMQGRGTTSNGTEYSYTIGLWDDTVDFLASGIWCGIFVVISGVVGLASRGNTKLKIITYLIWNVIGLLFAVVMMGMTITNTSKILDCMNYNTSIYISSSSSYYGNDYNWSFNRTQFHEKISIFGEELTVTIYNRGQQAESFLCADTLFTNWLTLEVAMMFCSLIAALASLWALIHTSVAASKCCASDEKGDEAAQLE